MGVTTRDIFGTAGGPQPAVPGSYGEPPQGHRLPDATSLGPVRLQITDLERSLTFYRDVLGLRVLQRHEAGAALGAHDGRLLVELEENRAARPARRGARLGLYHYAILLPDRAALGRFVRHLADRGVHAGAGDHLVSEAFYLQDPDGLGIEVYADRPRSTWQRTGRELMMATDPVDVPAVIAAAGPEAWDGMPAGTVMGHVHLHVGNLDQATSFYAGSLGFDRTVWSYPGALFLGAGGYHHHVGVNTWAGPGARPAGADEARLLEWTLELPDAEGVAAVAASLAENGHAAESSAAGELAARDPWGTRVRVRPAPARQ